MCDACRLRIVPSRATVTATLNAAMQAWREASHLFRAFRLQVRLYIMALKANGALNALKPKPMQAAEIRRCAEATNCGSITIMYGRVAAFLKMLSGARNPVFVALTWGHVHFIPTYYVDEVTQTKQVRGLLTQSYYMVAQPTCACMVYIFCSMYGDMDVQHHWGTIGRPACTPACTLQRSCTLFVYSCVG